jgi:translocation and assembly module TamA
MNFLGQLSASGNHVLTANYFIPGKNPALNQYILSAGIGHINIKNSTGNIESTNEKVSASYVTHFGDIQQTVALTYLNERYILPAFNLPYINSNVLYPSIIWQYVKRDKSFKPTRGFSAYAIVSGSPMGIGGVKFFQARVRLRAFISPTENTRLLARIEAGHTEINNLTQLPLSLQLLAGGVDSIRGFSWGSIGPGYNLLVGSVELQRRIKGPIYVGFFVDSGSVFQGTWYTGAGPSIAVVSPVGTIEASLGKAISPKQKGVFFDFSMGQDI